MRHNGRCPFHDYRSRSIYLITINKGPSVPDFSLCYGKREILYQDAGIKYLDIGKRIKDELWNIRNKFPHAAVKQYVVMPDHIHFVLDIQNRTEYHLGDLISVFKHAINDFAATAGVFEDGYHDRILRGPGQYDRMVNYIKDNPRRRLIKTNLREFFGQPKLINLEGRDYITYGNFFLLKNPVFSNVRFSSKYSPSELGSRCREWEETIRSNGVLVSPFIHDKEKKYRDLAIENGASLIQFTRNPIGERFKPAGRYFDLCAEGRLLLISTYQSGQGSALTRAEALAMNSLAEAICKSDGSIHHLRPLPRIR